MPINLPIWTKQAIIVGITFALFIVSGADAAHSFLSGDLSGEILGSLATVLAAILGFLLPALARVSQ